MKDSSTGPTQAGGPAQPPTASQVSDAPQSAARTRPLEEIHARAPGAVAVKERFAEAALNAAGAVRDHWTDFRSSDRRFKYKVGIIAAWLLLSAAGFMVAYPRNPGPKNTIGARLVKAKVLDTPVFMIVNESGEPWENVVVEVNYAYQAAVRHVSPQHPDNNITLEARKLLGEGGAPAPSDLKVVQLHVRTSDGAADLIVNGRELE
jgi:hypothetical protein